MNRSARAFTLAWLVACSVLALAPAALAYEGELPIQVGVTGPGSTICGETISLTATVLDAEGAAVPGQDLSWAAQGSGSSVGTSSSVTNAQGQATTSAVVGTDGAVFTATVEGARGSQVVECDLAAAGLPRTDATPAAPPFGTVVALLVFLLASIAALRSLARVTNR
jgi:hypothetical protein